MKRVGWDEYFLNIAREVSTRSTCFSEPKGALIVKEKSIVSAGYNGAPVGISNCAYDLGYCQRKQLGFKSGEALHLCRATHAEANAIIKAAYHGVSTKGTTLYCTHQPCNDCSKLLINAGIIRVVYLHPYPSTEGASYLSEANVVLEQFNVIIGGE